MTSPHDGRRRSEKLRALIVGLGSVGQRHARNLRTLLGDRVELSAYRVRRQSPVVTDVLHADDTQRPETAYGIRSFDSLDDALADRPDIAWICNPTSEHLDTALLCAGAGCDLFMEKPIADSMRGVDRLRDLASDRGLIVGVGSQLRFHPILQRVHSLLHSTQLGHPLAIRAEVGEYLPGFHPYEDYRTSYAARRELGGGVILTLIHEIDYLVWLFGVPRRVFAVGGHLSSLEIDVEDVSSALMECHRDGVPFPVHVQMDYVRRPPRRNCSILADQGSADFDLRSNRLTVTNDAGDVRESLDAHDLDRNSLFISQMMDFLDAWEQRRAPAVGLSDGADALRVADAVRESMTTRSVVELQ